MNAALQALLNDVLLPALRRDLEVIKRGEDPELQPPYPIIVSGRDLGRIRRIHGLKQCAVAVQMCIQPQLLSKYENQNWKLTPEFREKFLHAIDKLTCDL